MPCLHLIPGKKPLMNRHSKAVGVLAASAAIALSLAACSSGTSGGTASASASTKIVYVPGLTGNPFYSTVSCGAGTEAKKLGVKFATQGSATFDVTKQTEVVNAVVASKPAAIMISITDPKAMIAPLQAAKAAGIKIIGIDGDLESTSIMTTNIEADGEKGGELAGEALAKIVDYKGSVMAIDNVTGSLVSKARTDGFEKAIKKYPKMKYLGIQYSNNDVSKAASISAATATTNSSLVGIFSAQTSNTEGAITGVRQAGKTGTVHIVGYDSSDPIVAALKAGTLDGTVVQNPRGEGALGVESAVNAINGKKVTRQQTADQVFATPENVDTANVKKYLYDVNCKG